MKKFLVAVLILILLTVGGIGFFVVHSFNPTAFQQQIVRGVKNMTGREFTVIGQTQINWFPNPQIVLNDVTLSNKSQSAKNIMLHANKIIVQLEWTSLFKSPLVIKKIDVEKPDVYLERLSETNVNWDFPFLFDNVTPEMAGDLMATNVASTSVDALTIHDGSIEYLNQVTNAKQRLSNVNGNLVMNSLQGPYTYNGTFSVKKKTMSVEVKVGQISNETPVAIEKGVLIDEHHNLDMTFNGNVTPSRTKTMKMELNASFNVKKPNEILAFFGYKPLDASLNVKSAGSLSYQVEDGIDGLKNFTIRFGNQDNSVALTGSLEREKGNNGMNYKSTVAINKLNYDHWKGVLSGLTWTGLTSEKTSNFDLKFDISELIYGKNTIQKLTGDLSKKGNRLQIENGKATLIGNTAVTFSGSSIKQDEKSGARLQIVSETEDFKQVLGLITDVKKVPNDLMKKAKFSGEALIYPNDITVDIQSLALDKGKISGKFAYLKTDKLPELSMNLTVDSFDLDKYVGFTKPKETPDLSQIVGFMKQYFSKADYLARFNGTFDLNLKNIRFRMMPINAGVLVGSISNGVLKFDKFETSDFANATLKSEATINGVGTDAVRIVDLKFDFKTNDMKLFMDKVNLKSTSNIINSAKVFDANVSLAETDKNVWTTDTQIKSADLEFSFKGNVDTTKDELTYNNMNVFVSYPNFRTFTTKVMPISTINTSLSGPFTLKALTNGTLKVVRFSNAEIQIGENILNAEGSYTTTENGLLDVTLTTPSFDTDRYIWNDLKNVSLKDNLVKVPFKLNGLNNLNQHIKIKTNQFLLGDIELKNAFVDVRLNNSILTLNEIKGTYGSDDAPVELSGSLSWDGVPKLNLDLSMQKMPLNKNIIVLKGMSIGDGIFTGKAQLSATGSSPYAMLQSLSGKGDYAINNLEWIGIGLEKVEPLIMRSIENKVPKSNFDKALNILLNSGKTIVESITGSYTVNKGVLHSMDAVLQGNGYSSDFQMEWRIAPKELDVSMPLSLTKRPDLPPFKLMLKGKLNRLAYQSDYMVLSDSVSDIVQDDKAKIANAKKVEQERQTAVARTEREEKARQAVFDAREAVKQASAKVKSGDNQRALDLLQNAQDAMDFMNNLSIKETLTDAEYMQLTEQSRLAILKAEEAVAEATNDKFFEDRKLIKAYMKQSQLMQQEIERIHNAYPDIEIVSRLLPLTKEHTKQLATIAMKSNENESDEEHYLNMETAKEAYISVVKGYRYILRFDENATPIEPLSVVSESSKLTQTKQSEGVENQVEDRKSYLAKEKNGLTGHISRDDVLPQMNDTTEKMTVEETQNDAVRQMTVGQGLRGSIRRVE